MVKQIYTEEEFNRIEQMHINSAYYIKLRDDVIQEWIEKGFFAHLKKELSVYHDLYFACRKLNGGCLYAFFFNSENARNRFQSMIGEICDKGQKVRIVDCIPEEEDERIIGAMSGTISACPLF